MLHVIRIITERQRTRRAPGVSISASGSPARSLKSFLLLHVLAGRAGAETAQSLAGLGEVNFSKKHTEIIERGQRGNSCSSAGTSHHGLCINSLSSLSVCLQAVETNLASKDSHWVFVNEVRPSQHADYCLLLFNAPTVSVWLSCAAALTLRGVKNVVNVTSWWALCAPAKFRLFICCYCFSFKTSRSPRSLRTVCPCQSLPRVFTKLAEVSLHILNYNTGRCVADQIEIVWVQS